MEMYRVQVYAYRFGSKLPYCFLYREWEPIACKRFVRLLCLMDAHFEQVNTAQPLKLAISGNNAVYRFVQPRLFDSNLNLNYPKPVS